MRKLISSPVKMSLSETENQIYQKTLNLIPELMLNLMAVKVENHPEDFSNWCKELCRICREDINFDLLETNQLPTLKKLHDLLESGVSITQLKMLRIAPWPIFNSFISQQFELQSLAERLTFLDYLQSIKTQSLADMIEEDRLAFTGKHTNRHDIAVYKFDVEWFGSTKGAKIFHQLLQNHANEFDIALACIPSTGEVNFQQYQKFVAAYIGIFNKHSSGEKAPLAAATRLLAMHRPDQFIALTNTKIEAICQGFNIVKFNNRDFDSYWHDLIGTLRTMSWWHQEKPECENELRIWQYRAILVDVFLFADNSTAQNSNYLRLVQKAEDKANNKITSASTSVGIKRTKASVESLVDKALENEELPAYLINKRDSIVKAVKEGKSIDHVINMMRAIFG
ncbi:MAG: hypothetical protein MJK12_14210 [Colwellia sp.]|nr:hypothetical protein [Colwellia sp.]